MDTQNLYETFLSMEGRLNRLRYFKRLLVVGIAQMALVVFIAILFADMFGNISTFGSILMNIIFVAGTAITYTLDVRRLHDMDKSDLLAKVSAVAMLYIGLADIDMFNVTIFDCVVYFALTVIGLYLMFNPGTRGENQYGSDPLER